MLKAVMVESLDDVLSVVQRLQSVNQLKFCLQNCVAESHDTSK